MQTARERPGVLGAGSRAARADHDQLLRLALADQAAFAQHRRARPQHWAEWATSPRHDLHLQALCLQSLTRLLHPADR
jgi:hypothetical protein